MELLYALGCHLPLGNLSILPRTYHLRSTCYSSMSQFSRCVPMLLEMINPFLVSDFAVCDLTLTMTSVLLIPVHSFFLTETLSKTSRSDLAIFHFLVRFRGSPYPVRRPLEMSYPPTRKYNPPPLASSRLSAQLSAQLCQRRWPYELRYSVTKRRT